MESASQCCPHEAGIQFSVMLSFEGFADLLGAKDEREVTITVCGRCGALYLLRKHVAPAPWAPADPYVTPTVPRWPTYTDDHTWTLPHIKISWGSK